METSYLKTLELDKIIARAAEGCVCKEAHKMLLALQPQCDPDEVRYALEQTDAINTLLIKNGSPRFGGVENVSQLAARAVKGGVLSMGELLMVAGALRNFQNLSSWYGASEHDALPTDDLFYALAPQPSLEQQISSAILAPDAMADTASHTLNDLRKKIRATENSIRDRLESMVRNMDTSKYLQESVVSMRNGRYVVPVKSEYRGEVSGIIHDVSSTGATVFVEPQAVVEANARILQYRAQEAQEIERILVAFTAQVAAIEPQFQYSYKAMLEIDVLLAKARLALDLKAFKPAVRTDNSFSLIRARHPLIDPKKCVPVDIALGREYDSLIITGPNTGGKTVSLKTLGLLSLMAASGLHIPANEQSEIGLFEHVYADIGDEQSIEQSLSTFSAHMKTIVSIMDCCGQGDIVLFDELGAGTDPVEGAALAVAVIGYARQMGACVAATTHYAELKTFALTTDGVENASCEFDVKSLQPTYRLLTGIPGKSNAFAIAARLGLQPTIIERAKEQVSTEDARFEDVLAELERERRRVEQMKEEAQRMRSAAQSERDKMRAERDAAEDRVDKMMESARGQADNILKNARMTAETVFDELETLKKKAQKKNADQNLAAAKAALRGVITQTENEQRRGIQKRVVEADEIRSVQKGDRVRLLNVGGVIATVLAPADRDGGVQVQAGPMKMTVKENELRLVEEKKNAPKPKPQPRRDAPRRELNIRSAESEVDVRGMSAEEALFEVDNFLSRAIMAGLPSVTVIHGKGTGVLRTAVQQHLRKNKRVKSVRSGVYGEGEQGVTIVELR